MLRVIQQLSQNYPITIKQLSWALTSIRIKNHKGYIDLIINEMLPEIAKIN
jgi:imidazolonepropionase